LNISAKNAVFFILSGKKHISPLFGPPTKLFEESTRAPLENLSDAHAHKNVKLHIFAKNLCCITPSGIIVQQHQGRKP